MIGELLDSLSIWPFTEQLGKTRSEVLKLADEVRTELGDATLKLYIPV